MQLDTCGFYYIMVIKVLEEISHCKATCVSRPGRHYRVYVNNVFMFMKGSNWIPAHILPEMVTPKYTRDLLQAAVDAHMNCLRVWGGGIYETDVFYEVCYSKEYYRIAMLFLEGVLCRRQLILI